MVKQENCGTQEVALEKRVVKAPSVLIIRTDGARMKNNNTLPTNCHLFQDDADQLFSLSLIATNYRLITDY